MMAGRSVDVPALVDAARAGAPRAIARLISLVEDGHPAQLMWSFKQCPA
jgi:LAO/AO transport system kinase